MRGSIAGAVRFKNKCRCAISGCDEYLSSTLLQIEAIAVFDHGVRARDSVEIEIVAAHEHALGRPKPNLNGRTAAEHRQSELRVNLANLGSEFRSTAHRRLSHCFFHLLKSALEGQFRFP